jgi:NAD(P)-dependent dehydrogenase (short-subunit alcohol dehydrogenase family)
MQLEASRPIAVVTGASAGIGKAAAHQLVGLGWQVVGVGRDPERSMLAAEEIADSGRDGGNFTMLRADFTLMAEVQRTASEVAALLPRVDVLINNAGGVRDQRIITSEGLEATFAVNHLAPFLLTRELMPLLESAAGPSESARVIAVASTAHRMSRGLDWDDLQSIDDFHPAAAYGQAKLATILFTRELARRAGPDGIVAQAMHPGVVASNFAAHGDAAMQAHMAAADTVPPSEPAETLIWLATDPGAGRPSGRYFHRKQEELPTVAAQDDAAAERLWVASEKLLADLG